jgi:hypothetical protein
MQSITKIIVMFIRRRNTFSRDVRQLLSTHIGPLNDNGDSVIFLQRREWPGQVRTWAYLVRSILNQYKRSVIIERVLGSKNRALLNLV